MTTNSVLGSWWTRQAKLSEAAIKITEQDEMCIWWYLCNLKAYSDFPEECLAETKFHFAIYDERYLFGQICCLNQNCSWQSDIRIPAGSKPLPIDLTIGSTMIQNCWKQSWRYVGKPSVRLKTFLKEGQQGPFWSHSFVDRVPREQPFLIKTLK